MKTSFPALENISVSVHILSRYGSKTEALTMLSDWRDETNPSGNNDTAFNKHLHGFTRWIKNSLESLFFDKAPDYFLLVVAERIEDTYTPFLCGMITEALRNLSEDEWSSSNDKSESRDNKNPSYHYPIFICEVGNAQWFKQYYWGKKDKPAGESEYPVCVLREYDLKELDNSLKGSGVHVL